MNEVVREFLLETHENLAQIDLDLVTLEKEPTERETLARVFRTLHTVKGTAGFLGLPKLQAVAHAAENLLSRLRAGELVFQGEIASTLLAVVDVVRQMLASIEASENEGAGDYCNNEVPDAQVSECAQDANALNESRRHGRGDECARSEPAHRDPGNKASSIGKPLHQHGHRHDVSQAQTDSADKAVTEI